MTTADPCTQFATSSAKTLAALFPEPACDECRIRGRHVAATYVRQGERKALHVCDEHKAYFERLDDAVQRPVVPGLRPPHPQPPPFVILGDIERCQLEAGDDPLKPNA